LHSSPEDVASAIVRELDSDAPPPALAASSWDDCATGLLGLYREVSCAS
jgi:hypothetical protein